jgi:hypothetical protein
MLSAVERGQKVPSILVMGQIATALSTSIGRLVDEERSPRVIAARRGATGRQRPGGYRTAQSFPGLAGHRV